MATMVERAARTLMEADGGGDPEWDYRPEARAAIAAMREPSEGMVDAGYEHIRFTEVAGHMDFKRAYQAAIDAALAE